MLCLDGATGLMTHRARAHSATLMAPAIYFLASQLISRRTALVAALLAASSAYLLVYSRLPDEAERDISQQLFAEKGTSRRQAAEDLLWALLNTPEFMFKD